MKWYAPQRCREEHPAVRQSKKTTATKNRIEYYLCMPYRESSLDMVFEMTDKGGFVVLAPWGMYESDLGWFECYWAAMAERPR